MTTAVAKPSTKYTGPEAFVDIKSRLVWIVGSLDKKPWGETLKVHFMEEPTIENGKVSFSGRVLLEKDQKLEGALVGDLIPFLTTKIDAEVIVIKDLPGSILEEPVEEDEPNQMFGKFINFDEIEEFNSFILYVKSGGSAVLSSDEVKQENRAIFVFKDIGEANMALNTLRSYPPFKEKFFYKGAEVYQFNELGETASLEDERFIYFDLWQKCVANLSHHMRNLQKNNKK